jgi:hypothetical protein
MAVVHHDCGDNSLAMHGLGVLIVFIGRKHSWPVVVGHVFGFHREGRWQWIFEAKCAPEVEMCLEERVKAEVGAQAGPVVAVCYVMVLSVEMLTFQPINFICWQRMVGLALSYKRMNLIA